MAFTAAELRRRARDELREHARRREVIAVEAVARQTAAQRLRQVAEQASVSALEALAAAAVTFGGLEAAASVTGIASAEFRAARRDVSAERAAQLADEISMEALAKRARRKSGAGGGEPPFDVLPPEIRGQPEQSTSTPWGVPSAGTPDTPV
jgi:hypothetical protein